MSKRPTKGCAIRSVLAPAVFVVVVLGSVAGSSAEEASDITVTVGSRWGDFPPGSWTPYVVTVRNQGGVDVEGEVVLAPQRQPPLKPGAQPTTTTTVPPVPVIEGRAMTAPLRQGPDPVAESPEWPSYSAAVAVPAGTDKTLMIMVVEAPFGYKVEVRDTARGLVARAVGPVPASQERIPMALLSDVVGAEEMLEALPQKVAAGLGVFQMRSAREFPDTALHLSGLAAVAVVDFDTAALTARQRRALQDYVSLGGSLLLGGGAAWSRTLESLPTGLVPVRPSGTTSASLLPLADLVGATTASTATITTGEAVTGRVVVAAPGAPPLVVESDYGAGRVVQLAYDPLAEPIISDESLRGLAWDQGLSRVASRWSEGIGTVFPVVGEEQLWARTLQSRPWPSWPRWGLGVVGAYIVVVGPLAFALGRRGRPEILWLAVPLASTVIAAACLGAAQTPSRSFSVTVELLTQGTDGTVLTTSYTGTRSVDVRERLALPSPAGASTVLTGRPPFRTRRDSFYFARDSWVPRTGIARGSGTGTLHVSGDHPYLRLPTRPWELRTVQTLSIHDDSPGIEAALRLVDASKLSPGRLTGTVTNRGPLSLQQLRAQTLEGQAKLADVIMPGETVRVDEPLRAISSASPDTAETLPQATDDESGMFAAANRAFSAPGQIALVASTAQTFTGAGHAVIVTVITPDAADTLVSASGRGRLVAAAQSTDGRVTSVFDAIAPAGAGPLSLRHRAKPPPRDGREQGPLSTEVYNWVTGGWRTLPPIGKPRSANVDSPVEDAEVNLGLVRVRTTDTVDTALYATAQLVLRATSEEEAVGP